MKYASHKDPYSYKDAPEVLINKLGIKDVEELDRTEQLFVSAKMLEIDNYPKGDYSLKHYLKTHKYLFEKIYDWAGEIRQVTIQKGTTIFPPPQYVESAYNGLYKQMKKDNFLKNIKIEDLHKSLAFYHGEINIIHPFREGNGRTTRAFLSLMAKESHNIELDYKKVTKEHLIKASINSSAMDYDFMERLYQHIISKPVEKKINKDMGFDR
jgi:cell filamentation protein